MSDIVHSRGAKGEEDGDAGGSGLVFEGGGGAVGEVEVDAAGVPVFDEVFGLTDVKLRPPPSQKGVFSKPRSR